LSVGIGNTLLTLSGRGKYSAKVDGGIGNLNLMIPEGMAARIRSSQGLGNLSVSNQFIRQGDYNVSAGYDTAEDRVDLSVSGGIGNVSVQMLPGSK
jgi:predicted membrane protein